MEQSTAKMRPDSLSEEPTQAPHACRTSHTEVSSHTPEAMHSRTHGTSWQNQETHGSVQSTWHSSTTPVRPQRSMSSRIVRIHRSSSSLVRTSPSTSTDTQSPMTVMTHSTSEAMSNRQHSSSTQQAEQSMQERRPFSATGSQRLPNTDSTSRSTEEHSSVRQDSSSTMPEQSCSTESPSTPPPAEASGAVTSDPTS